MTKTIIILENILEDYRDRAMDFKLGGYEYTFEEYCSARGYTYDPESGNWYCISND